MYEEANRTNRFEQARSIGINVLLAIAPPDEELLNRHFDACTGRALPSAASLTPAEQKWVTTNLENNPSWQKCWRKREDVVGRSVAWEPHESIRPTFARRRVVDRTSLFSPAAGKTSVAALVAIILYVTLWLGGRALLPQTYHWASLAGYEALLDQQSRSTKTAAQSAFSEAATELLTAHKSTLGLFPHYDRTQVNYAMQHLEEAYDASSDPFQRAEIAFFRAKTALMIDDVSSALTWLEQVELQQVADYRTETQRLLQQLAR